jgi:AP-4 complex subunit epsilon-1
MQTLLILNRVDQNIVTSFYVQTIQSFPSELSVQNKNEYTIRLLEVLETQSGDNGEAYARESKDLLERLEAVPPTDQPVLEAAVERILLYVRECELLTFAIEPELPLGQTLMVIISALACEFCGQSSLPPLSILKGLNDRLSSFIRACHAI